MRLIDAEQTAKNFKDVSVRHKYEELKIDGKLTVGDVLDAVVCDLIGNGIVGTKLAPTVPAIPMERIKQLREEMDEQIEWLCASELLDMVDDMIKEYGE